MCTNYFFIPYADEINFFLLTIDTHQPATLVLLPMYHIFAFQASMRMLRACHKLVVLPQFTAENLINALDKYQVILLEVPFQKTKIENP